MIRVIPTARSAKLGRSNFLENAHLGLLFLIPGTEETLRVNGGARVIDDPELLAPCARGGRVPDLGLLISVQEVYFHCARALLRSSLWKPETWPDRSELPTPGPLGAPDARRDPQ